MTAPKKQSELTEITRGGEWVVMPETPLEITRRVNLHAELVAALEAEHDTNPLTHQQLIPCAVCTLLRKAKQVDR